VSVLSLFTLATVPDALLPSCLFADPVNQCLHSFPARRSSDLQPARPDNPSEQLNFAVTFVLFQPAAFASGVREPAIVGAVLSMLTCRAHAYTPVTSRSLIQPATEWKAPSSEKT